MEVTTFKTNKSGAKELYSEIIQKDIDVLEREKINEPEKNIDDIRKHNILNILNNVGSIFRYLFA